MDKNDAATGFHALYQRSHLCNWEDRENLKSACSSAIAHSFKQGTSSLRGARMLASCAFSATTAATGGGGVQVGDRLFQMQAPDYSSMLAWLYAVGELKRASKDKKDKPPPPEEEGDDEQQVKEATFEFNDVFAVDIVATLLSASSSID